jgi:putative flippase GtrA
MGDKPQEKAPPIVVSVVRGSRTRREIVAFLLVGLLNTGFGYAVYAFGYLAGLNPSIALAVAFCTSTLFNFFSTGRLVFQSSRWGAMPKYAGLAAGMYVVNAGGLNLVISLGVGPLEAQALVMCFTVPLSFLVSKFLVFARPVRFS